MQSVRRLEAGRRDIVSRVGSPTIELTGRSILSQATEERGDKPPLFDLATAPYNWKNIIWLSVLHLMGLVALVRIGFNIANYGVPMSWTVVWWAAAWFALSSCSVTVGYHRGGTHQGFVSTPVVEALWLYFGGASIENDYISWRNTHMIHHMYTDLPNADPHTPQQFPGRPVLGFSWSHMLWMLRQLNLPMLAKELPTSRLALLQCKYYVPVAVSSFVIPWAGTWSLDGLLIAGFLRVLLTLHFTACINSVAHYWGEQLETYRQRKVGGNIVRVTARNVWFWLMLWLFSFGESWHNNHHKLPQCVRHGLTKKQIDITAVIIWLLEKLHGIRDVKWLPEQRERLFRAEADALLARAETITAEGAAHKAAPSAEPSSAPRS